MRLIRDGIELTEEQREFVALARDFAEREIRPRARDVDEADVESPLDLWEKAAASRAGAVHAAGGVRRWRSHRPGHAVPGPGGALLRRHRHRQLPHLQRVLRRSGPGAGHRGAEASAGSAR